MISVHKLEVFAAVFRLGSFSAAAQQLYLSQPAVSQHIQDVETQLGTPLFNRVGARGVVPTEAGTILYDYTVRMLQLMAEVENRLTNVRKLNEGEMHIGATAGVSVYLFPHWLQTFQAQYPNLRIQLHTSITPNVVEAVIRQDYPYGIIEGEIDTQSQGDLQSCMMQSIPMELVVGRNHTWWDVPSIELSQLHGMPFITRQTGSLTRRWMDHIFQQHNLQPRIIATFDNPESIKNAVMANMGLSLLPAYSIQHELENGFIRVIPIVDSPLERELKLVWSSQVVFSPIAFAFLNHLVAHFAELVNCRARQQGHLFRGDHGKLSA